MSYLWVLEKKQFAWKGWLGHLWRDFGQYKGQAQCLGWFGRLGQYYNIYLNNELEKQL